MYLGVSPARTVLSEHAIHSTQSGGASQLYMEYMKIQYCILINYLNGMLTNIKWTWWIIKYIYINKYISQKVQLYNLHGINTYIKWTLMDIFMEVFLQKQQQYNLHGPMNINEYISQKVQLHNLDGIN